MTLSLTSSKKPRFIASIALMTALSAGGVMISHPALATDPTPIMKALEASTGESNMKMEKAFDRLQKRIDDSMNGLNNTLTDQQELQISIDREPSPMLEILRTYSAYQVAISNQYNLSDALMYNRQRELNHVPFGDKRADYLVDSSFPGNIDVQYFDIFMRFFCDPQARDNGDPNKESSMKNKTFKLSNIKHGGQSMSYTVGCGYASDSKVTSRRSVLGNLSDTGVEAQQLIGLPLRPDVLFFNAGTFPSAWVSADGRPKGPPTDKDPANVNRLADVYYGAFTMAMRFLLDVPPPAVVVDDTPQSKTAYITAKANVTRHALASQPFIELFTSQLGTMGPNAAKQTAELVLSKLSTASEDKMLYKRMQALAKRENLSVAEYMDLVMNQLMMSPGYYKRINYELTPAQLQREIVWLTGMQTALNYQRNRWLEMLAALEAVSVK